MMCSSSVWLFCVLLCVSYSSSTSSDCDVICSNRGECADPALNSTCRCYDQFYEGDQCEIEKNYCQASPCQNDGICEPVWGNYFCKCNNSYLKENQGLNISFFTSGVNCENKMPSKDAMKARKDRVRFKVEFLYNVVASLGIVTYHALIIEQQNGVGMGNPNFFHGSFSNGINLSFKFDSTHLILIDHNVVVKLRFNKAISEKMKNRDGSVAFIYENIYSNSEAEYTLEVSLFNENEKQFDGKYYIKTRANPDLCIPKIKLHDCGETKENSPSLKRMSRHTIRSIVEPDCPGISEQHFNTTWSLFKITPDKPYPCLGIHLKNKIDLKPEQTCCGRDLELDPDQLDFGLYTVLVKAEETIEAKDAPQKTGVNGVFGWIRVEQFPPDARIAGGIKRKLWIRREIIVNGTQSTDPNQPPEKQDLSYSWYCWRLDGKDDSYCKGTNESLYDGPELHVPPNSLAEGEHIFQLTVTIKSPSNAKPLEGVAQQRITVDASDHPTELEISCLKNCDPIVTSNPIEVVYLEAICKLNCEGSEKDDFYEWEIEGQSFDFTASTEFGSKAKKLAILEEKLDPGQSYMFSVKGGTGVGSDSSALATYTVVTTSQPSIGTCQVEPPSGDSVTTLFNVTCSGFQSVANGLILNLYYYFYQPMDVKDSGLGVLLQYDLIPNIINVKLLPGTTKVTVKVKDEKGMSINAEARVNVSPGKLSYKDIRELVDGSKNTTSLKLMVDGNNVDSIVHLVSSLVDEFPKLDAKAENLTERQMYLFRTKTKATFLSALSDVPLHTTQAVIQIGSTLQKVLQTDLNSTDHRSAAAASDLMKQISLQLVQHTKDLTDPQRLNSKEIKELTMQVFQGVSTVLSEEAAQIMREPTFYKEDPQEDEYAHYDLDDEFVELTGDFNDAFGNIMQTLQNLAHTIGMRQEELLRPTILKSGNLTLWVKHDKPTNLAGKYLGGTEEDEKAQLGIMLSHSLANKLQKANRFLNLQITTAKKNPLWFKAMGSEMNSMAVFVNLEEHEQISEVIQMKASRSIELPEPLDLFLAVSLQPSNASVEGSVSVKAAATPEQVEESIAVHRVDMYDGSTLYLEFVEGGNPVDVVVIQGRRPGLEDFSKAVTIPRPGVEGEGRLRIITDEPASGDNVWFYIGILPHSNPDGNSSQAASYSFKIYKTRCCWWDSRNNKWAVEGCEIGRNYTLERLHCRCTHLSLFAGSIIVAPNKIDPFNDVHLFLTFTDNPLVVSLVIAILLLYLLLLIILRRLDRKDIRQRGVTVLEDNLPEEQYGYLVAVYTGSKSGAGTTSTVAIQLVGSSLKSRAHLLRDRTKKLLQRNTDCWFLILTRGSLGDLQAIRLWSDNAGRSPAWYCVKVVVTDVQREKVSTFVVERWLSVSHGDGKVYCEVGLASEHQLESFRVLFTDHANLGFREDHLWFSIALRHPRSNFTRCQRLGVAVCLLLLTLLANMMFYGIPKNDPGAQIDIANYTISTREFMIPLQSLLVTIPVSVLIVLLFRKSRPLESQLIPVPHVIKVKPKEENEEHENTVDPFQQDVKPKSGSSKKSRRRKSLRSEPQRDMERDPGIEPRFERKWVFLLQATPQGPLARRNQGAVNRRQTFTSSEPVEMKRRQSRLARGVLNVLMMDPLAPAIAGVPDEPADNRQKQTRPRRKKRCCACCYKKDQSDEEKEAGEGETQPKQEFRGETYWFPSWCIYVAWVICILVTLIAAYIVCLYGLSFGHNKSLLWLTSIGIAIILSIFIIQPLKVIVIAIILALVFKKQPKTFAYECTIPTPEDQPKTKYLTNEDRIRFNEMQTRYRPLPPDKVRRIRSQELMELRMASMLNDLVMYLIYIVTLYWVVTASRDSYAYLSTKNVQHMVIDGSYVSGPHFHEIKSMPDLIDYLNNTLIPNIHAVTHYNGDPINKTGQTTDPNTVLLGISRLRQLRVRMNNSCTVLKQLQNISKECYGEYNNENKETGDFSIGWTENSSRYQDLGSKATDPWQFQSSLQAMGLPFVGEFALYSAGGYIAELGRTQHNSRKILRFLVKRDWFDIHTRAVLVEFTLYNANRNLFNVVVLTAERGAAGAWYLWEKIQTVRLLVVQQQIDIITVVAFFICVFVLFLHFSRQVTKAKKFKVFFRNVWNIMDIVILLLAIACFVLYHLRSTYVYKLMTRLEEADGNEYVSFLVAAYWEVVLTYVIGILIGLSTVRLWKLLHFGRKFRHFERTLVASSHSLITLLVMLAVILMTFVSGLKILLGSVSEQFRSMYASTSTLLSFAIGFNEDFDYSSFWQFGVGPFFLYSYCLVCIIYMVNMFITVIMNYYETVEITTDVEKKNYGPIDYLGDQLKHYFHFCHCGQNKGEDRMRGGADEPEPTVSHTATPKSEEARNTNAVKITKEKLNAMKMITLHSIMYGAPDKNAGDTIQDTTTPISSDHRLAAMTAITLDKIKENDDEKEEEAFYKGKDGKEPKLVPDSKLQEMEDIVNKFMPRKQDESGVNSPNETNDFDDKPLEFQEIDDMEILGMRLDRLAKLLEDLPIEDEEPSKTPEQERGDTKEEPVESEPKETANQHDDVPLNTEKEAQTSFESVASEDQPDGEEEFIQETSPIGEDGSTTQESTEEPMVEVTPLTPESLTEDLTPLSDQTPKEFDFPPTNKTTSQDVLQPVTDQETEEEEPQDFTEVKKVMSTIPPVYVGFDVPSSVDASKESSKESILPASSGETSSLETKSVAEVESNESEVRAVDGSTTQESTEEPMVEVTPLTLESLTEDLTPLSDQTPKEFDFPPTNKTTSQDVLQPVTDQETEEEEPQDFTEVKKVTSTIPPVNVGFDVPSSVDSSKESILPASSGETSSLETRSVAEVESSESEVRAVEDAGGERIAAPTAMVEGKTEPPRNMGGSGEAAQEVESPVMDAPLTPDMLRRETTPSGDEQKEPSLAEETATGEPDVILEEHAEEEEEEGKEETEAGSDRESSSEEEIEGCLCGMKSAGQTSDGQSDEEDESDSEPQRAKLRAERREGAGSETEEEESETGGETTPEETDNEEIGPRDEREGSSDTSTGEDIEGCTCKMNEESDDENNGTDDEELKGSKP